MECIVFRNPLYRSETLLFRKNWRRENVFFPRGRCGWCALAWNKKPCKKCWIRQLCDYPKSRSWNHNTEQYQTFCRRDKASVNAALAAPCPYEITKNNRGDDKIRPSRFQNQGKNSLSSIVGSYKSAVTKHIRRLRFEFNWQPRFYDHIIRDTTSYLRISQYIDNNPANLNNDKFRPANKKFSITLRSKSGKISLERAVGTLYR